MCVCVIRVFYVVLFCLILVQFCLAFVSGVGFFFVSFFNYIFSLLGICYSSM